MLAATSIFMGNFLAKSIVSQSSSFSSMTKFLGNWGKD